MKKTFALIIACLYSIMLLANHWTPESSNYSDVMAMNTVIQINGVEQYSDLLEVGVFCGDECRGSAIASEFPITHRYLALLTVYGQSGHQLTFKLYDHSTGQEYEPVSQESIIFNEDGYGNPIEPYVLNFSGEPSVITQTIQLSQGWNWFSTNVEITLDDLKAALVEALLNTNSITIKGKNAATTYNGTTWRGQLNTLDVTQMYKIEIPSDCVITVEGFAINLAEHPLTITANAANWIAFPLSESMSLSNAFAGFAVSGDQVKGKGAAATYNGIQWRGTLNTLVPGQGYIYKSNSNEVRTFIFPSNRQK